DVWSLGACLYHLLTGAPPFLGEMARLMLQITKDDPTPVTHFRPDLPPEIDSIVGWALAKDVDARFRDVHAFAHALAPFPCAEGQVLIERIGRMTQAARSKRAGSLPPPAPPPRKSAAYGVTPSSAPLSAPSAPGSLDFDDSVTQFRQLSASPSSPVRLPPL